jgi:gliding motility-associated-like protein
MTIRRIASLLFIVFLFTAFQANAQREAENWYFGKKAGLKFSPGQLQPTVLQNSRMQALEGCATISDSLGRLLFFTAGDTVYNFGALKMNNGWKLTGHQSASQSSVIVQEPYSPNRYYLFTIDALGGTNGLRYSIVDASYNTLGNVVAKNIPLLSPVSEKITAVDHRYSRDAWVIVHGSGPLNNSFYAYRVTKPSQQGASAIMPPVISNVGISHTGTFPNNKTIGYMKVSPDGKKLALAMQDLNLVELYDFNDSSGVVSNPKQFKLVPRAYGVEFSRDGSKLYVSTETYLEDILQFNLDVPNPDSVGFSVLTTKSVFAGALQLAPNGMIYVANTDPDPKDRQYLSIIKTPDSLALKANGDVNTQQLNSDVTSPVRISEQGLPNFNQSYLWYPAFKHKYRCIGDQTAFTSIIKRKIKGVRWDFGDPASGPANTSFLEHPIHQFSAPNTYNVTLTVILLNNRTRSLTIPVTIAPLPQVFLGLDKTICPDGTITLTGPEKLTKYLWNTGETTREIKVTKPGLYWLEVRNANNCANRDSIKILPKPGPQIFAQKLVETCAFIPVKLRTKYRSAKYTWGNESTDSTLVVNREGWFKVTVPYNGCNFTDSVQVVFKDCPDLLIMPNIITPNGDDQNDKLMLRGVLSEGWQLQIYNRWGRLIYDDKNYRNNWPQQAPPAGTYYYRLQKPEAGIIHTGWLEVAH